MFLLLMQKAVVLIYEEIFVEVMSLYLNWENNNKTFQRRLADAAANNVHCSFSLWRWLEKNTEIFSGETIKTFVWYVLSNKRQKKRQRKRGKKKTN